MFKSILQVSNGLVRPTGNAAVVDGRQERSAGFTRLELAVTVMSLALLAAVALPALANTRPRSQQVACANNLGRISQAFSMWSTEHGGFYPWQALAVANGSSDPLGLRANVFYHFFWISNELATPKILACPSDNTRRQAEDFSSSPAGGFLNANYRNNAVSYVLCHPFLQEGRGVLSGDRNFDPNAGPSPGCAYFAVPWSITAPANGVKWTSALHVNAGNLLFNDGAVEQTDSAGLRASFTNTNFDTAGTHLIYPN